MMNALTALVSEALKREQDATANQPSWAPETTDLQGTISSSCSPEGAEHLEVSCWLCLAPLPPRLTLTLPGPGVPRALCYGCFGRCYRDLYVRHRLRRSSSAQPSLLPLSAQDTDAEDVSLAAAGRSIAAAAQSMEPQVASVALRAAPKCSRCRTLCPVARNSPDGLPGSLCIDGQPHVRWRCLHCQHLHCRGGATCERCGRNDGAHRWQCPGCLRCGRDGAGDPWGERVSAQPSTTAAAAATNDLAHTGDHNAPTSDPAEVLFTEREAQTPSAEPSGPPLRDEDYQGPGGRCGHCGCTYKWFIHDDGAQSTVWRDKHKPFEERLWEAFTTCGYEVDASAEPPQDLFTSLTDSLLGDREQSETLRQFLVRYMEDNEDTYLPYFYSLVANKGQVWHEVVSRQPKEPRKITKRMKALKKEAKQLFRRYRARVRHGERAGDELCLQAASRYFNVVIHIFTADLSRWHVVFAGEDPERSQAAAANVPQAAWSPASDRRGSATAAARCFLRQWAPIGADGKAEVGTAERDPGSPVLLVDERVLHPTELHFLQTERAHLFLRRSSPCEGYVAYKSVQSPLAVNREDVLASISASLREVAEVNRKAEEIKRRLESRPAVPARLQAPPKVDDEMDDVRLGSGPVGSAVGSLHPPPPPPRSHPPKRRLTLQPQFVAEDAQQSRAPPSCGPSPKRWANRTACLSPTSLFIPARAQDTLALPQREQPSCVDKRRSFPDGDPLSMASATAVSFPGPFSPPSVPLSRAPRTTAASPGDEPPPHSPPSHPPRQRRPPSSGELPVTAPVVSA